jgi:catechol 2,3-dioxygenase-like lactoylglutathione lyase family enzyme
LPERHVFFRVGTSVLLCFDPKVTEKEKNLPAHYAHGPQHIAFSVSPKNYEDIKSCLVNVGLPITHTETWKGGLESFYFEDPCGNVLEIVPENLWD